MGNCNNCAWFCHADGRCYGSDPDGNEALPVLNTGICHNWQFDGLEDWEREPETLVTMAEK